MRTWDGGRFGMCLEWRQLRDRELAVYVDGELWGVHFVEAGGSFYVGVDVSEEEVDIVVLRSVS